MTKVSAELTKKLTNEYFSLSPIDNHRQANLCGPMDDNLKAIERRLGVEISYIGQRFNVVGKNKNRQAAIKILKDLYLESQVVKGESKDITPEMVHLAIIEADCLEQEYAQKQSVFQFLCGHLS